METRELNLCELLKGCEGMVFYSTMVGYCRLIEVTEYITIRYEDEDDCLVLESDGKYSIDGECTLFQSKENRDWSTFVNPNKIKEGTPVMKAKEFYELNKGKYFMYRGNKVRVVGFNFDENNSHPIMISYGYGWWDFPYGINESIEYVVDESLINDNDKGLWVSIQSLKKIEEELNLCEILKGCEGVELWSDIFGKCKLESSDGGGNNEIEVLILDTTSIYNMHEQFTKYGRLYDCYPNGKCMLWPSETNRDWSTFVKPIKIKEGTPVMTKWNSAAFWKLESYAKDNKSDFIVPVSDFDFTDFDSNKSKSIV